MATELSIADIERMNAQLDNAAEKAASVKAIALAAGYIRDTYKRGDVVELRNGLKYRPVDDTIAAVYNVLTSIGSAAPKDGKGDDGMGSFGMTCYMSAAMEATATLRGTRSKEGKAPKVRYGVFSPSNVFIVNLKTFKEVADAGRDAKIAAAEKAYDLTVGMARVEHMDECADPDGKDDATAIDKKLADATDNALKSQAAATGKARAAHKRAMSWFHNYHDVLPMLLHALRTLDPAGRKVGGVTYNPDAVFISLVTGYNPSTKDVVDAVKGDVGLTAAMDQVKKLAKENRKTIAGIIDDVFSDMAACVETGSRRDLVTANI
jgi:hypothetical protein